MDNLNFCLYQSRTLA